MKKLKDIMLLKKICDFYWYDLKISGNKIEIINEASKDFSKTFNTIENALKHFTDTMIDSNEDCQVWDESIITYIESL